MTVICQCQDKGLVSPKVKTSSGIVCGKISEDKQTEMFFGVPFAEPPVGELRFQAPKKIQKRQGEIKCTEMPPSAMQNNPAPYECWDMDFQIPPSPISEDCLYLNIWKPAKVAENEKLPVLVWIHGGGFVTGSGTIPLYGGETFAQNQTVYVTINYRVGIFGFLAHRDLAAESPLNTSGNYGILDQIEALKWINENIEKFSGDKNNITIAGQSCGSYSVNALMVSPLAKGLFNKAILQSGGFTSEKPMFTLPYQEAENYGEQFLQKRNLTIEKLRQMPADSVQKLPFYQSVIAIDEKVVPTPKTVFEKGQQNCKTIISGYTETDGCNFDPIENEAQKVKNRLIGFGYENWLIAKLNAETGGKSYLYMFRHLPPDEKRYGVFHSSELGYALGTLKFWHRNFKDEDYVLSKNMNAYWREFVKTGNPNFENAPEIWEEFPRCINFDTKIYMSDFQDEKECEEILQN